MRGGEGEPTPIALTNVTPGFQQFVAPVAANVSSAVQSHWVVLVVIVGLVVLGALLWWLVKRAMSNQYGEQAAVSLVGSPVSADVTSKFAVPKIPAETNGKRLTMSFWMYVSDFSKNDGAYRHVLHVGQDDVSTASPLVFLDRTKNRLVVWFSRTDGATAGQGADLGAMLRSGGTSAATLNVA